MKKMHPKKNWTSFPNKLLQDKELTYEAKGLLQEMYSRPEDWVFHKNQLERIHTGLSKINRIFKELRDKRYIALASVRDENLHRIIDRIWFISLEPYSHKKWTKKIHSLNTRFSYVKKVLSKENIALQRKDNKQIKEIDTKTLSKDKGRAKKTPAKKSKKPSREGSKKQKQKQKKKDNGGNVFTDIIGESKKRKSLTDILPKKSRKKNGKVPEAYQLFQVFEIVMKEQYKADVAKPTAKEMGTLKHMISSCGGYDAAKEVIRCGVYDWCNIKQKKRLSDSLPSLYWIYTLRSEIHSAVTSGKGFTTRTQRTSLYMDAFRETDNSDDEGNWLE